MQLATHRTTFCWTDCHTRVFTPVYARSSVLMLALLHRQLAELCFPAILNQGIASLQLVAGAVFLGGVESV